MKNVSYDVVGDTLTITVKLSERLGPSASGKTIIIASTEGAIALPNGEQVSLNVYVKK